MIGHYGISCVDYPKSQRFYDRVLGVLGCSRQADFGDAIGYGSDGKPAIWTRTPLRAPASAPTEKCISPSRRPTTTRCGHSLKPPSS